MDFVVKIAIGFIPFLFALCFHEFAHAWVAKMRGDRTAEMMGRLTVNPLAHMDPLGTFILPLISIYSGFPFFGWAKPVPVTERNLKNPRVDMFWISLAGPLSNVFLALVATVLLTLVRGYGSGDTALAALQMLQSFLQVNLVLAFFNMIPVHPLDGGKVLERFLPYSWNRKLLEMQQMLNFMLLMLMFTGGFRLIFYPVSIVAIGLDDLSRHIAYML